MKWFVILIGLLTLTACETTQTRIYNPNKPISEYDADLYKCTMMARDMNPTPTTRQGSNVQCISVGVITQCNQQANSSDFLGKYGRNARINAMKEECMARQGWGEETVVIEQDEPPHVSEGSSKKATGYKSTKRFNDSDRGEHSFCLNSDQCASGLACIYDKDTKDERCHRSTDPMVSKKSFPNFYNSSRGEHSFCLNSDQCASGLACIYDKDTKDERCHPKP